MKKSYLLLLSLLFSFLLQAQDSTTLTICTYHWKDKKPLIGAALAFGTPKDTNAHCFTYKFPKSTGPVGISPKLEKGQDLNGITVADLLLISDHILGIQPLPNPSLMAAADANRSNSITALDIVEIRKLILNFYTTFPSNKKWYFFSADFSYQDPVTGTKYPLENITLSANDLVKYNNDTLNYWAYKTADIDGDAETNIWKPYIPKTKDTFSVELPDLILPSGQYDTIIPVFVDANNIKVQGLQLEFRSLLPAVKIEDLTNGSQSVLNGYFVDSIERANICLTEYAAKGLSIFPGKPLFNLKLKINSPDPIALKNALSYPGPGIPALIAERTNAKYTLHQLKQKWVTLSTGFPQKNSLVSAQVVPNPFKNNTLLHFDLLETHLVLVETFDLNGRLLWSQEQMLSAGKQQVEIPAEAVPVGQMALYRIRAGNGVATGKLRRE